MTELFAHIPEREKERIRFMVNLALRQDVPNAMNIIESYRNLCDDILQEYMDFYFHLRLEELKNESNTN